MKCDVARRQSNDSWRRKLKARLAAGCEADDRVDINWKGREVAGLLLLLDVTLCECSPRVCQGVLMTGRLYYIITSPQRHLRKARRSLADEKNNKLLVSRSPSKLTVKSRSWPNTV